MAQTWLSGMHAATVAAWHHLWSGLECAGTTISLHALVNLQVLHGITFGLGWCVQAPPSACTLSSTCRCCMASPLVWAGVYRHHHQPAHSHQPAGAAWHHLWSGLVCRDHHVPQACAARDGGYNAGFVSRCRSLRAPR